MKGIALVTIGFLPDTYAAVSSTHARPSNIALHLSRSTEEEVFEFSNPSRAPTVKSGFWIYWAITITLATIVLVPYLLYLVRIQRRDRLEDHKIVRRLNEENNGRSTHVHSAHTTMIRKGGASTFSPSRSLSR